MTLFIVGEEPNHHVGEPECPECREEYPEPCPCGGLIHAAGGEEDDEGSVWLATRCDQCGRTEEEVDATRWRSRSPTSWPRTPRRARSAPTTFSPAWTTGKRFPRVAVTAAMMAQAQGVARLSKSPAELHESAARLMREAREASRLFLDASLIRRPPDGAEPWPGEAARRVSG